MGGNKSKLSAFLCFTIVHKLKDLPELKKEAGTAGLEPVLICWVYKLSQTTLADASQKCYCSLWVYELT